MRNRLDLDRYFRSVDPDVNLYFQPPDESMMKYPCLRYEAASIKQFPADNRQNFITSRLYEAQYITKIPDDPYVSTLLEVLSDHRVAFEVEREYVADGLYHTVLNVWW